MKKRKTEQVKSHMVNLKTTKKELNELKAAYKSRKLKFDSKKVAESILKDFKHAFEK